MADSGILKEREAVMRAVERIAASPLLRTSEALCSLLRYLAQQTIDQPETPPKEYQIATEVFGRRPDFDSRLDSTVRVQTGRLRSKLAEYYAGPGSEDDLILGIPKGSYSLSFHHREPPAAAPAEPAPPTAKQTADTGAAAGVPARRIAGRRWFFLLLASAVAALGAYLWWRIHTGLELDRPSDATRAFWQVFLSKKQAPLVIFSNAEFVGAPTKSPGMRYFNPATDSTREIRDHYTGIGEVFAVHELDRLFARFGVEIRLKRGRLLTWDDAKGGDLIFIGSTVENLPLRELPERPDFVFKLTENPAHNEILNLRPGPGEQPSYRGSSDLPTTEDYGLVALLPALEAGNWVLILAGTNTLGTQAAAEFVCRPETLQELVNRLHLPHPADAVPFEAVIKTEVSGGVPVRTRIVALHVRSRRRS
jgi:hypothetical protein